MPFTPGLNSSAIGPLPPLRDHRYALAAMTTTFLNEHHSPDPTLGHALTPTPNGMHGLVLFPYRLVEASRATGVNALRTR